MVAAIALLAPSLADAQTRYLSRAVIAPPSAPTPTPTPTPTNSTCDALRNRYWTAQDNGSITLASNVTSLAVAQATCQDFASKGTTTAVCAYESSSRKVYWYGGSKSIWTNNNSYTSSANAAVCHP